MLRKVLVLSKIKGLNQAVAAAVAENELVSNAFELCFPDDVETGARGGGASFAGDVEVVLGDPNLCAMFMNNNSSSKWIQSTFAGVEPLIEPMKAPQHSHLIVSRCAALGKDMAQFVAGMVIAHERRFFDLHAFKASKAWTPETRQPFMYRPLSSVTVGVIGLGDIGRHIAEVMSMLGCRVVGFKRTPPPQPLAHVELTSTELPEVLAQSDYLVNVLPSTPATQRLLSGAILEHCQPKSPLLLNLGRGSVIDDASLLHALDVGWISGAVLDVFDTEPLPAASPLWSHPKVTITPHVGALSHPDLVAATFVANAQRFLRSEPLHHLVDAQRGY